MNYYYKFAAAYNESSYGAGIYTEGGTTTSTESSQAPQGGLLADTGYNVLVPLVIGVALIAAGVVLLVKRVRNTKKQ